jgi:TPR repeat protein
MRLGRAFIAAVLAAFLAAAPRAGAEEVPHPQRQLTFQEACALPHTRVELRPQIVRERLRSVEARLPQSADQAAWDQWELVRLARSYEDGIAGAPDLVEAARLYCLVLARAAHAPVPAMLLANLYARGLDGPPDPEMARHFARIAAGQISPEAWRADLAAGLDHLLFDHGEHMDELLAEASAWLSRMWDAPAVARLRTALQYLNGAGVPRSDRLGTRLLWTVGGESAAHAYLYAHHMITAHPALIAHNPAHRESALLRLQLAVLKHSPEATRFTADLYRDGRIAPADPVRAYFWYRRAQALGAADDVAIDALYHSLSPDQRAQAADLQGGGLLALSRHLDTLGTPP